MGTGASFPGGEAAGTWSWPLTSIYCRGQECVELYLHSPSRPSWRGAQLKKAQGQLYIYLLLISIAARLVLVDLNDYHVRMYEGRLQSSWTQLITPNQNFVEVRWRSLFSKYLPLQTMHFLQLSTHSSKTCCKPLITSKFLASEIHFHGWKSPEIAWGEIWIKLCVRLETGEPVESH
jgi:hypothetical protein